MKIRMALVLGLMVVTIGGCKTARLKTIDPVSVANDSAEQTHDIVYRTLVGRRWGVVKEDPGTIHAMLPGGAWSATILLSYDAESVTIRYLDSANLKYRKNKKGREYIHKNYNVWIKRLADDIRMLGRSVKQNT